MTCRLETGAMRLLEIETATFEIVRNGRLRSLARHAVWFLPA